MNTAFTLSAGVLGGMEDDAIVKDFEDLGVGVASKGGGCKDYYNLDHMNAPLSCRIDNRWLVSLFLSIVLLILIVLIVFIV
jgi:hypothetical protein